jgi:hypothetical protein
MSTCHLALGEMVDFITGRTIVDTHDERARQKIARLLVEEKGYARDDIEVRREIPLNVNGEQTTARVDFLIRVGGRALAVVIFGPGSLVSRERAALAAARLIDRYAVPISIVTNGKDAEVMDTHSGKVIGLGLHAIPSKEEALRRWPTSSLEELPQEKLEKEQRLLYMYDVLARRECEEYVCSLAERHDRSGKKPPSR